MVETGKRVFILPNKAIFLVRLQGGVEVEPPPEVGVGNEWEETVCPR